jgi:hypothetical protein
MQSKDESSTFKIKLMTQPTVNMEVNGRPYYMKSKGNVPYLYDIDTHDEVGYWSSKKGQYVMFSLYNKLMSNLKDKKQYIESNECDDDNSDDGDDDVDETDSSSKSQDGDDDDDETDSSSKSQQDDDELEFETDSESDSDVIVTREAQKSRMNTYSLIFVFLLLFVYLTLQKEFQSIYFDVVFLVLINVLNILKVFEIINDE